MKFLKNKYFWQVIASIIGTLISMGMILLFVMVLKKILIG